MMTVYKVSCTSLSCCLCVGHIAEMWAISLAQGFETDMAM